MSSTDPLSPSEWGIDGGYHDALGQWREPGPDAVESLRAAMGTPADDPLVVLRPGEDGPAGRLGPGDVALEDGTTFPVDGVIPADLPIGYHRHDGPNGRTNLIVSPGRCHLPADLRTWGITAQLYAARSTASWGIGDLTDLRTLIGWATDRGAGIVGLNPLHAPNPLPHPADSPYSPSSRRFRDPLYIAVEAIPQASAIEGWDHAVRVGRQLSAGDRIDRAEVWAHKRKVLREVWELTRPVRRNRSDDLTAWGTFCALVDHHGSGWPTWPVEHRRPDDPAVARFARDHADDVDFWCWLQDVLDTQLAESGATDVVIADLAVGFAPDGFDAWQWQDLLAPGVHIGAPPDLLGPDGQDWGLPPFVPWRLRHAAYQPFATTIRSVLRHARGLRVDHVMGLFRLLWVPPAMSAADGAYVRFRGRELLDVLAIESARAGALVIGEDLGTVEPGVRETLGDAGVLSTRLLWFEDEPPENWPRQAMGAVSTHDLPTLAGVWSGADGDEDMRHRLRVAASAPDHARELDVAVAAHRRLGRATSMVVTATLDDITGAEQRPNVPGTVDEHPNWRIPLPLPVDRLDGDPRAEAIASALMRP